MNFRLNEQEREQVKFILNTWIPTRKVKIFGSRTLLEGKPYSDLDLCIMGEEPLTLHVTSDLREAFAESDLPFRVDLVDWSRLSLEMQLKVMQEGVDF